MESKKSVITNQLERVRKAHWGLLKHHAAKVKTFTKEIESLKEKVNTRADQHVDEIQKNRGKCIDALDAVYEKVLVSFQNDMEKVQKEVELFEGENAALLKSIAETPNGSVASIENKAENMEKMIQAFESQLYLPKMNLTSAFKLEEVNVEWSPATSPTIKEPSLDTHSPTTAQQSSTNTRSVVGNSHAVSGKSIPTPDSHKTTPNNGLDDSRQPGGVEHSTSSGDRGSGVIDNGKAGQSVNDENYTGWGTTVSKLCSIM